MMQHTEKGKKREKNLSNTSSQKTAIQVRLHVTFAFAFSAVFTIAIYFSYNYE